MTGPSQFSAAFSTELLKLRRGVVVRLGSALLVLLLPLASIGAVALARSPQLRGPSAAKFAPYASGDLAVTHLIVLGQLLAVSVLLAGGFAAAWSFGREFGDGTVGAMAGLPVGRGVVALAKGVLLTAWLTLCAVAAVLVTGMLSVMVGGRPSAHGWHAAAVALGVGLLSAGLCAPFGWAASVTRSQLGTVGVLIGLVMVTQVVVTLGGGQWFPYAIPSLASGMGGDDLAQVGPGSLALTALMGPLGVLAAAARWARLDRT